MLFVYMECKEKETRVKYFFCISGLRPSEQSSLLLNVCVFRANVHIEDTEGIAEHLFWKLLLCPVSCSLAK